MIDIKQRKNCLRVKIVKKLLQEENSTEWKKVMKYFLNKVGNFNLGEDILWLKTKNWMTEKLPGFYQEILSAWGKFLDGVFYQVKGRENLLNQPLFLNKSILKEGKELFFKKWMDVGILRIRDVLYEFKKGFLTKQYIVDLMEEAKEEYSVKEIENKLETVKGAIPKEWITRIENMEECGNEKVIHVYLKGKLCDFKDCLLKDFYVYFRDSVFQEPIANNFWVQRLNSMKKENIWKNMRGKIIETRLECFEYFIRHKAIFTECILTKIQREPNATCKVCFQEDEGILHLFLYCKELECFYMKCQKMLKDLLKDWDEEQLEWNTLVMFGWNMENKNKKFVNLLIMMIKKCVWERRNVAKQEKVVLNVWNVLKRKMERYIERLYWYFKGEDMLPSFYDVFNDEVYNVLNGLKWKMPKEDVML